METLYENTGIQQSVIDSIRFFAKKYDLQKVILFGPRAKGTHDEFSNIALALSGRNTVLFTLEIDELIDRPIQYDFVDINKIHDEAFLEEIEEDGINLYERS